MHKKDDLPTIALNCNTQDMSRSILEGIEGKLQARSKICQATDLTNAAMVTDGCRAQQLSTCSGTHTAGSCGTHDCEMLPWLIL